MDLQYELQALARKVRDGEAELVRLRRQISASSATSNQSTMLVEADERIEADRVCRGWARNPEVAHIVLEVPGYYSKEWGPMARDGRRLTTVTAWSGRPVQRTLSDSVPF